MSGTACSSACGWCGACSSSWEHPTGTVTTACVRCTGDVQIDPREVGDIHWCPTCIEVAKQKRERRQQRTA